MRIPIEQIPTSILERLKAIQASPTTYDCFYKRDAGRGSAIFGLIFAGLALLVMVPWTMHERMSPAVPAFAGLFLGAIIWGSISRIRRYGRAPLKPMVFVNPLYLARANLDYLTYHGLWSELRDLKIVHHHTNGAYTHTMFHFYFKQGGAESLSISPKRVAEQLADLIESYRQRMIQAIDSQNAEAIIGHDVFIELRDQEEQAGKGRDQDKKREVMLRRLLLWGAGGGLGAVAGLILGGFGYVNQQARFLEYCHTPDSCDAYFELYSFRVYSKRAREQIVTSYKRLWETSKTSVRRLRQMQKLDGVPHVTPEQEKEVLALYRDGSARELRALYQQAIDKYKTVSTAANPQARDGLIKMLELARDKGYFRVKVSYASTTDRLVSPASKMRIPAGGYLVPMLPSFTPDLNKSREGLITDRIQKAFIAIVPQDILQFPDTTGAYGSGSGSGYGRYGSGSYGSGSYSDYDLPRRLREAVATPVATRASASASATGATAAAAAEPTEIEFKVGYVVFPSGQIYVSKRSPGKLYTGIGFDWAVGIDVKGEKLYAMRQQSFPPARFTVTSYGSKYAPPMLGDSTVYATMATTAFDDFSKNIVQHFGIPTTTTAPVAAPSAPGTPSIPGLRRPLLPRTAPAALPSGGRWR